MRVAKMQREKEAPAYVGCQIFFLLLAIIEAKILKRNSYEKNVSWVLPYFDNCFQGSSDPII